MEEKNRYEIHRYTLQGNEKISFNDYAECICEHYDFGFEKIKPFNQRIQDLLNQQDKRIKELDTQLKQSQNQKVIEELEKVKNNLTRYSGAICNEDGQIKSYTYVIIGNDFEKQIDNQIKKLKGGENDGEIDL